MPATRRSYSTDLTAAEWQILEPLLPSEKSGGRHRLYELREIINALRYLLRIGCSWRLLPHDFPHRRTVYEYFKIWKEDGTRLKIHDYFHAELREQMGRERQPSAGIVDSQSVKMTEKRGRSVATTAAKRLRGANGTSWLTRPDW